MLFSAYAAPPFQKSIFQKNYSMHKKKSQAAGGGSPLTLRPNFKSEKGSVTADKPPVRPAGGFLLTKIHKTKKPPLKGVTPHGVGRCPQGRGDRSVRGGPPLGGGGILVESSAWCKRVYRSTPQSVLRTASSAQGTPCGCPFRGAYAQKGKLE